MVTNLINVLSGMLDRRSPNGENMTAFKAREAS